MSNYIVRQYTYSDFSIIADFFNRNMAYQIDTELLTSRDIELSFKVKEVERFYLLFHSGKLVGTTGMFHYIYSAKQFCNSIYSGFLLIDPKERNGVAIRSLIEATYDLFAEKKPLSYYSEINIENKPSLQLSKLNGYIETGDTWEDTDHYLLLRSDLPKIKHSVKNIFRFLGCTSNELVFEKAFWDDDGYQANFKIGSEPMEITIKNIYPWRIIYSMYKLELHAVDKYSAELSYEFDKILKVDRLELWSENGDLLKSISYPKNGSILVPNDGKQFVQLKISNDYGVAEQIMSPLIGENIKLSPKFSTFKIGNSIFSKISIELKTGNVNIGTEDEFYIEDLFPVIYKDKSPHISIKYEQNVLKIVANYCDGDRIQKMIFFGVNKIHVEYDFKCKKTSFFWKYGLKQIHHDYLLKYEKNKYLRFVWQRTPSENMDFMVEHLLDTRPKFYYLPGLQVSVGVSSEQKSSNQMNLRPLFLHDGYGKTKYDINIFKLPFNNCNHKRILGYDTEQLSYQIKNLRVRKELDNNALNSVCEDIRPATSIEHYDEKTKLLEIMPIKGLYTGIYFNIKAQGNFCELAFDQLTSMIENGAWIEEKERLQLINKTTHKHFIVEAENGRIFVYKKHNRLFFRIVIDNYKAKNKILIRFI